MLESLNGSILHFVGAQNGNERMGRDVLLDSMPGNCDSGDGGDHGMDGM